MTSTRMLIFLNPDCDTRSRAHTEVCLASDLSLCSAVVFLPLGNSDNVADLVLIGDILNLDASAAAKFCEWFMLRLMSISLIKRIIHLHSFQLLVLLSLLMEVISFVCSKRISL